MCNMNSNILHLHLCIQQMLLSKATYKEKGDLTIEYILKNNLQ